MYSGGFENRNGERRITFIAFIVYRSPFHVNAMPNLSNGFSSSY